jgi:DNA-binding NarL/FixJ family response regulator
MEPAAKPSAGRIRVLIADDHALFAEALETILSQDERMEVCGRAANGQEAVDMTERLNPTVVLMDISMPLLDGFDATRAIRQRDPNACILMLTGSNSPVDVDRARKAGVAGYVTKDRIAAHLIDAIVEVAGRELS